MSIRYGVTIEFDIDSVLDGGPSKHEIRRELRQFLESLPTRELGPHRWLSLRNVGIKYLHEASTTKGTK